MFGHSLLGYTLEKGRLRIEPEGAKIVRQIFDQYLYEKKGSGVIARELCEAGVVTNEKNS